MQHYHKYQHFALDSNDNIINIHHTETIDRQQYFCPYCRKEMITKLGNIRQWHFAHKSDTCSYDNYLHSIAEKMIMDWFNKQKSITLIMKTQEKCIKYENCDFYSKEYCQRETSSQYDLKKYYSTCTQEQRYGNFIADLLCKREGKPTEPLFIEIFVTHECSQEKKDSNIRIIEFCIQSEEDILNIINSSRITENYMVRLYNYHK